MKKIASLFFIMTTVLCCVEAQNNIVDNKQLFEQVLTSHIAKMESMGIVKPTDKIFVEINERMMRFLPEKVKEHTLAKVTSENLQELVSANSNEIVYHYINPLSILNGQLSIVVESCPAINKLNGVEFDRTRMFVTNTPIVCDGEKCYIKE